MTEQQTSTEPRTKARLAPGTIIDERFEIVSFLGEGGMSVVYLAKQPQMGREVALKMLQKRFITNEEAVQRFRREAVAAASLDHPNIVKVYGFGVWDNQPYMAMELLDGTNLSELLKCETRLSDEAVLPVLKQILSALSYAHQQGIVHRDLKPSNVMLVDNKRTVKLVDFGIARLLPEAGREMAALTATDAVFGTAQYMSPEQCTSAKVDGRSDLYSLGCLLYELLEGEPPFTGSTVFATMAKQMGERPLNSKRLGSLQNVVHWCLEKKAENRPQTAEALQLALEHPQSVRSSNLSKKRLVRVPKKILWLSMSLLVVLLGAFAVFNGTKPKVQVARPVQPTERAINARFWAERYLEAGLFSRSLKQLDIYQSEMERAGDRSQGCFISSMRIRNFNKQGAFHKAALEGEALLAMPSPPGLSPYYVAAQDDLIDCLRAMGRRSKAVLVGEQLCDYLKKVKADPSFQVSAMWHLVTAYRDTDQLERAEALAREILRTDIDGRLQANPKISQLAELFLAQRIISRYKSVNEIASDDLRDVRSLLTRVANGQVTGTIPERNCRDAAEMLARLPK